jgi:hypothetical protein
MLGAVKMADSFANRLAERVDIEFVADWLGKLSYFTGVSKTVSSRESTQV